MLTAILIIVSLHFLSFIFVLGAGIRQERKQFQEMIKKLEDKT